MTSPAPAPKPDDWKRQTFIVMQRADKDVLSALRVAQREINAMLKELATRQGIGASIRREQLLLAKRNIQGQMAILWRRLGDITAARRLEAANGVIDVNKSLDAFKLVSAGVPGGPDVAQAIADAELDAAASGLDRMIARVSGASYIPLSQRVYTSTVVMNGRIDRLVNSALARGLSAREFAREIKGLINPNTPGGVRYAAFRLARTEINNAAHAVAIDAQRDKPWTTGMQWHLSSSHPRVDECDRLARGGTKGDGVYAKDSVPAKPHPVCFCYVTPVVDDEEDFLDNLIGGKYNSYLDKYRNIQPGQVVRSHLVGEAPAKVIAPKPPASPPSKTKPVQVSKPTSSASVAPTRAARVTAPEPAPQPTPQDLAKQYSERFWKSAPTAEARTQLARSFAKLSNLAPRAMLKLTDFEVLDAAGSRKLKVDTGKPNAIGGYNRLNRDIRFADETIGPYAEGMLNQSRSTGWWSHSDPEVKLLEDVLAHEFGHHIDQMVRRLPLGKQEEFWNEILNALAIPGTGRVIIGEAISAAEIWQTVSLFIKGKKTEFARAVSTYGSESAAELLAEIWQEYTNATGSRLRPNVKAAGDIMQRYGELGAAK